KKEKILMDTPIEGWTFTGTDVDKYKMEKDYLDSNQSDYSIRISSNFTDIDPSHDFSNLMQTFQAKLFLEKRMRLSAFIKSEDVEGWSGLWMRIDDKAYEMVGFDNMSNRPIKGSTSWNHYSCVLDIPKESMNINIGVILAGSGKIWIDDFSFDEVDDSISTTDIREAEEDRKSTRLNSSHVSISYAVFCLKKKRRSKDGSLRICRSHRCRPSEATSR